MKKILVCQHVAFEPLGTLNPLFKGNGFRIRYVNFCRNPEMKLHLEGYNGLVILGGPMNLDQADRYPHLKHEVELIQQGLEKKIPILGICLGAQLVAKALGAKVRKNPSKEIGWHDVILTPEGRADPILSHFDKSEKIFQWHGDTFDLPKDAVHLAASAHCTHQAFRYGDKVYGFQFHLEVDEALVERWLHIPSHLQELEELHGKVDPEEIRRLIPLHMHRLKELSKKTFGEFIKLLGGETSALAFAVRDERSPLPLRGEG